MKNKISKKFMRITSYTLIIITMITIIAIIVISKWISRDDYVPKKLGNSVSAALNNRYGSSCSIVENDKYIFYVNCVKDSFPLVRIDKNSGEKKLLKKNIGDSDGSALFIYKNTLIYTKSKDLGYTNRYYDIYSCDFDGKNEKLIKKESPVPHMVIDDYIYVPNRDNALTRISLINGQKRTLNKEECNNFAGVDKKGKTLYFETGALKMVKVKINKRRASLWIKSPTEAIGFGSIHGKGKKASKILGIANGSIWLYGLDVDSIYEVEEIKGGYQTKSVFKKAGVTLIDNSVMEKDKIYYVSPDETKLIMFDINTGEDREIYTTPNKNIKILAAIGDNILISEWVKDNEHVNYYDAVNDKLAKNYYINNSGKVLYELD
ncbi:MAG: DUF5050 domain-containing protein [Mogibacterium diversum]|uniref:DUF5050 domain-containing protein n=1 Tax=Mogibacterium diversum TaxID=114527 RepID=UPI001CAFA6A6|nr:DUF5050 domain-containing protein [Mogibacterium diversum]MBF1340772.1 DUF5050 domain-containing protein [Mogibacterium diversum]